MLARLLTTCIFLISLTMTGATAADRSSEASAAFDLLKTLVGEWEGDTSNGKAHLTYELVSGGTALVERESSDTMPAMLTVYHLDGERLILTHYCMAGNQPRMQAKAFNAQTGEVDFRFLDATNLTSPNAGHMRNAKIRVIDKDHLTAEWQFYQDGKPKATETFKYTRIK
jgi:hypothetical protein